MKDLNQMTTADHLYYNDRLIAYTLAQAHADGRPLNVLFSSNEWKGNVNARFILMEARTDDPQWEQMIEEAMDNTNVHHPMKLRAVQDDAYLEHHREQTGGGIDAATWGR